MYALFGLLLYIIIRSVIDSDYSVISYLLKGVGIVVAFLGLMYIIMLVPFLLIFMAIAALIWIAYVIIKDNKKHKIINDNELQKVSDSSSLIELDKENPIGNIVIDDIQKITSQLEDNTIYKFRNNFLSSCVGKHQNYDDVCAINDKKKYESYMTYFDSLASAKHIEYKVYGLICERKDSQYFSRNVRFPCRIREGYTYAYTDVRMECRLNNKNQEQVISESSPEPSPEIKTDSKEQAQTVYWTPGGSVYHTSRNCPVLIKSQNVSEGSVEESGKLRKCQRCP